VGTHREDISAGVAKVEHQLRNMTPAQRAELATAARQVIGGARQLRALKIPREIVMPLMTNMVPMMATMNFSAAGPAGLALLEELKREAEAQGAAEVCAFVEALER
jgi:hypothetical protein